LAESARTPEPSVILRNVPGCDPALWDAVVRLPDRTLAGPEQAWFNLMDPIEAAKILEADDGELSSAPRGPARPQAERTSLSPRRSQVHRRSRTGHACHFALLSWPTIMVSAALPRLFAGQCSIHHDHSNLETVVTVGTTGR
jgi:hypothetical protein